MWTYEQGEMSATALEEFRANLEASRKRRAAVKAQEAHDRQTQAMETFNRWKTTTAGAGEVVESLSTDCPDNSFLRDMAARIAQHQSLTPRQLETTQRILDEIEKREAERAAEAANAKPVPTGDGITVEGLVKSTQMDENPVAPWGPAVYRMVVQGDGWKMFGTVPAALSNAALENHRLVDVEGCCVRFVANVTASPDNESFGFFKWPRRAEILALPRTTDE